MISVYGASSSILLEEIIDSKTLKTHSFYTNNGKIHLHWPFRGFKSKNRLKIASILLSFQSEIVRNHFELR